MQVPSLWATHEIKGYPTIKYFLSGDNTPKLYTGARGLSDLQKFVAVNNSDTALELCAQSHFNASRAPLMVAAEQASRRNLPVSRNQNRYRKAPPGLSPTTLLTCVVVQAAWIQRAFEKKAETLAAQTHVTQQLAQQYERMVAESVSPSGAAPTTSRCIPRARPTAAADRPP